MKIGIITHYYKSINYGGNLQAYALCRVLNDQGFHAEQIVYDKQGDRLVSGRSGLGVKKIARSMISRVKSLIADRKTRVIADDLLLRKNAILEFNKNVITHSTACYNKDNIHQANDAYDVFITGSDQVWHPKAVCAAYLLDFAAAEKVRISYAASLSTDTLENNLRERFQSSLAAYSAISVRERDAVAIIQPISPGKVEWVLDPTLLLNRQQWDEICPAQKVNTPYLFCYFLGDAPADRKVAVEYAKEHGLKIVTLPHLAGRFRKCDESFGDMQLYDVTPNDLISLIKHAECVFTDSFHVTVFSLIYEKEFFVFGRSGHRAMGTRINSLTELFGAQDRFCDTPDKVSMDYIESIEAMDYQRRFTLFEEMRSKSMGFLLESIKDAEKKMQRYES